MESSDSINEGENDMRVLLEKQYWQFRVLTEALKDLPNNVPPDSKLLFGDDLNNRISGKIISFLKFVGKIQELLRKRSQKNHKDVILHYISLPIYPLLFPKFCPI